MERINQNVTPNFWPKMHLFPRMSRFGGAITHFITQRHEIPNTGAEPFLEAEIDADERMMNYWGDMATPETPVPYSRYEPGAIGGCVALPTVELSVLDEE